jgi:uncharacterized cofD-like protein
MTPTTTPGGGPKVVAFGGGHGLSASLAALRAVTGNLTAVVTVGDDGGSSGVLRTELGALPPGDLRMALAALVGDDDQAQLWAQVSQHRFAGGATLAGHPVGNLMLVGLADVLGDTVEALDTVAGLLGAVGRVLPLSTAPIDIVAEVVGIDPADPGRYDEVRGQVAVATTPGTVVGLRLEPSTVAACSQAIDAVLEADWLVFGPGSWFTSVIPHLLVPDMMKAINTTRAKKIVALNMAAQTGETEGFSPTTHLEVLAAHAPDLVIDVVLSPRRAVSDGMTSLESAAASLGAELVVAHLGVDPSTPTHDPERLASAFASIFAKVPTDRVPTDTGPTDRMGNSAWQ